MTHSVFPVILSGGAGTRLWPLSRKHYPKQFIALLDDDTLLQATARRLQALDVSHAPIVVCNERHRFTVAEQLQSISVSPTTILLEPVARNTAPAIAAAALEALDRCSGDDPVLLVLPADHVIRNGARFAEAVRRAAREAVGGKLVAFGVAPTRADTGYGYIKAGPRTSVGHDARVVEKFEEKPDADTAVAHVEAGGWYWNSGMFASRASVILRELDIHAASVRRAVERAHERATSDLGFLRLDAEHFGLSPAISVDRAIMENTSNAVVVPLGRGLVGRWIVGELVGTVRAGRSRQRRSRRCNDTGQPQYVCPQRRSIGPPRSGVADLVIVDTADAVLVADRNAGQDVKLVVERLERAGRNECKDHRRVYRPWGSYDSVHSGDGFKIKHIVVAPGQRLSLQAHRHRAEHWVVVRGTARVTRDAETFVVSENPVHLHSTRSQAPPGESRPGASGAHRGTNGQLPRGGRHPPIRRCLRTGRCTARVRLGKTPGMSASSPHAIVPVRRPGVRESMRRREWAGGTTRVHRTRRCSAFHIDC